MKVLEGTGNALFKIGVDVDKITLDGVTIWEKEVVEPTPELAPIYKLGEEIIEGGQNG